jgi:TolA-binding protein
MRDVETSGELSTSAEPLVKLACEELGEMSTRSRLEGFLKLNARRAPVRRRWRFVLSFAAALAVVAFVFIGRQGIAPRSAAALSYTVEGGRIDSNGTVMPTGARKPTLRFSDGTEVVVSGGARARVQSVGEHGARVGLNGKVDVAVVPSRGSHWLFEAGPFLINVTGTTFTADWREAEERLEVVLRTGSVSVSGPHSVGPINLRAGQRLIVSAREREVTILDIDAVAEAKAASPRPESAPVARPEPPRPAAASSAAVSAGSFGSNWTTELAAGRFAAILEQAERRGIDAAIGEVSSDELGALSDAARYIRRDDVARRALNAQRRRFPRSARANDAAFLLGRLEETAGNTALALDWYERCLSESANSTYTSEALGRKMTVVQRLHGAARARPIAEEYLRRFSTGTYAAAARALMRAP